MLEGYSMGAKGRLFDIGEATGIFKYFLSQNSISPLIVAPSSIKKHATGKGNANKFQMLEKFLENYRDKAVVLHRVNAGRLKFEPLFEKLKLLPLDYPIADALLLDRLGEHKLKSYEIDYSAQLNPLYIKRDVEKKS